MVPLVAVGLAEGERVKLLKKQVAVALVQNQKQKVVVVVALIHRNQSLVVTVILRVYNHFLDKLFSIKYSKFG